MFNIAITQEMVNKTTMRYHLPPVIMAIIKKIVTSVGKDVKKRKSSCTVGRNVNWYSHYRKQFGVSSKMKHRTTIQSSNSTSGYLNEENKTLI